MLAPLFAMTGLLACSGSVADNPIVAGGEVPALLASLPDGDYFAIGYLDIGRTLGAEIGRDLLDRLGPINLLLTAQGIDLAASLHELAFAAGFEGRTFPNLYRSLPMIAALQADIEPQVLLNFLQVGQTESFQIGETEVLRYRASLPGWGEGSGGAAFITFPDKGLAVLATSRRLLEAYLDTRSGGAEGIGGRRSAGMIERADKRVHGWMVLRHTGESRSLMRMLAGFDDCVISMTAGRSLGILCVMDFPGEGEAEESIRHFEFTKQGLREIIEKAMTRKDYRALAADAYINFMLAFKAERSADLAIFSAEFDGDWFSKLGTASRPESGDGQQ